MKDLLITAVFVVVFVALMQLMGWVIPQRHVHEWQTEQVQCPPCACPDCVPPVQAPIEVRP